MSAASAREQIVEYLRDQLIGPRDGPEEVLQDPPDRRYLMGHLYPQQVEMGETLNAEEFDDRVAENGREQGDDPIALSTQQMPSSVGLSFVTSAGSSLEVAVSATGYESSEAGWQRRDLCDELEPLVLEPPDGPGLQRTSILDGTAEITSRWRHLGEMHLITVALVNLAETPEGTRHDPSKVLCQVQLECRSSGFLPYPATNRLALDPEEEEQALLYRNRPTFAVGHGCAADWDTDSPNNPQWVRTEFLPTEVLPGISFDVAGHDEVRDLRRLAQLNEDHDQILDLLRAFADSYREWIESTIAGTEVDAHLVNARNRLANHLERAANRIDEGIALLGGTSPEAERARQAFALTNMAMLMQMHHSRNFAASRRTRAEASDPNCDYMTVGSGSWRPFQLAFILMTLPSVTDPEHPDHDTVDLIWFPTGGGKTEAYLGLVAYQVLLRRMEMGDEGAGTTVITRYTLRLLTTQQFQRSATLICALELLRRDRDELLGVEPFTIGIWVGGTTTPNTFVQAVELLDELKRGEHPNKGFQLEICPWCGTEVVPEQPLTAGDWGVYVTNDDFRMNCPNGTCPFHGSLPISVVDQHLYLHPPTFLVATIDKFARFAWDERPGVFLGAGRFPGPSLVLQDELHLISGPLGTVAALYEAAFDLLMRETSQRPKVIASTATIRRASEQVMGLFDRDVFLFPPSGMSHEDSYFVRTDYSVPGRRYVGVMAQSHTPISANVHTSAAILQAPVDLQLEGPSLDAYWTLVAYHNSLRELGKTMTLARDDIPARMRVIAALTDQVRALDDGSGVVELTSNIDAAEIPKILELLGNEHDSGSCDEETGEADAADEADEEVADEETDEAVSIVACTNMISVGVDIPRLSLMMVNGQPKSASEYIQATSRVGRDPDRPPGLIVSLYSAAKPRDRSHYESFKPYHRSIYREVEPTSVTPWTLPARERALHAAFVILVRHLGGLPSNEAAAQFARNTVIDDLINALVARCGNCDEREVDATRRHLERLVEEWEKFVETSTNSPLYESKSRGQPGLLGRFGAGRPGLWPTLDSMRNVDFETLVKVSGTQQ